MRVAIDGSGINATGDIYTHLEFYMGDTEGGYIYAGNSMTITAVVIPTMKATGIMPRSRNSPSPSARLRT